MFAKRLFKRREKGDRPNENNADKGKYKISFGMKIKLLVSFIILVAVFCIAITLVLNSRSIQFIDEQAVQDIDDKLTFFQLLLEDQEKLLVSLSDSMKYELMDVLGNGNRSLIANKLNPTYAMFRNVYGITHLQLNDNRGNALYYNNPESAAIDNSTRAILTSAMRIGSGRMAEGFEMGIEGLMINVVRPVSSYADANAGIIEVGRTINNDYLDEIKERLGVDFTVFKGNERIATTIVDAAGNRAVGTTIEHPEVLQNVLTEGERWAGRLEIVGSTSIFGAYTAIRDTEDNIIGMLFAGTPTLPYDIRQNEDRTIALAMLAIAILITALVSIFFANRFVGPLADLSRVFSAVAGGDLTVAVKRYGNDEVGLMGRAVAKMVEDLRGFVARIGELAAKVESLAKGVSNTAENISAAVQDVAGSTNEVASSTGMLSSNSQDMAQEASETAAKASSGQTEITGSLKQMQAIEGSFRELKEVIDKLGKRSGEIGKIVQVIDEISEQTNLLALNAAIEAARAGDSGRGFAVVADEVRKLAERSAASTKEIAGLIKDTQKDATSATAGMDRSAVAVELGQRAFASSEEIFGDIVASIQRVMEKIEVVAASSQELSASSEEMAASTQEQAAAVHEIIAATDELENASTVLYEELKKFKY